MSFEITGSKIVKHSLSPTYKIMMPDFLTIQRSLKDLPNILVF